MLDAVVLRSLSDTAKDHLATGQRQSSRNSHRAR